LRFSGQAAINYYRKDDPAEELMQKILFVINDAPYGSEKAYNALRLAMTLQLERPADVQIRVFLLADAVTCAQAGQRTPNGFYNIEKMVCSVVQKGGEVRLCGGCCEARGLTAGALIPGASISNMKEFAAWTVESDKVLNF
jgi:uncharacterized protein involved in oxidation of intracellular sulfur